MKPEVREDFLTDVSIFSFLISKDKNSVFARFAQQVSKFASRTLDFFAHKLCLIGLLFYFCSSFYTELFLSCYKG